MRYTFILMSLLVLLPSCLKTRVHLHDNVGIETFRKSEDYFLWGLVPEEKHYQATNLCASRSKDISYIESQTTPLDAILTIVTIGIYSPKTLIVRCTSRKSEGSLSLQN